VSFKNKQACAIDPRSLADRRKKKLAKKKKKQSLNQHRANFAMKQHARKESADKDAGPLSSK
jgi:hypothetical protein